MPRPLRIHVPGAFYHVTLRGNHRERIFFQYSDRLLLNSFFAECVERFAARLHAYCWMTNHIHALIQVGHVPLAHLMLRIAGRYARSVQSRLLTTGHLFEKRYHAVLVDADRYLLALIRYMHLNPVRAAMVSSAEEYPWSSHRAYLGQPHESWLTTDFALAMFHSDRARAMCAYESFMDETGSALVSPLLECNPHDQRILGNDAFAARMLGDRWHPSSQQTLAQLVEEACVEFGVTTQQLSSRDRHGQLTEARAWVAQQAVGQRIASIVEVARLFDRDESSMRSAMKRYFSHS